MLPGTDEDKLRATFDPYGEIVSVAVQPAKGSGFVSFKEPADAAKALAGLNK